MALVEVVAPALADPAVVARAAAIVERLGQDPGRAAPTRPGFIVNRVNRPFTIEALRILEAGAARVDRDRRGAPRGRLPDGPVRADGPHRHRRQPRGRDRRSGTASGGPSGSARRPSRSGSSTAATSAARPGAGFYRYAGESRIGEAEPPPTSSPDERLAPTADPRPDRGAPSPRRRGSRSPKASRPPDDIDLALRLGAGHPRALRASGPTRRTRAHAGLACLQAAVAGRRATIGA